MSIALATRKNPTDLVASQAALNLIMGFEGYSSTAYPDPYSPRGKQLAKKPEDRVQGWETLDASPWTIGFGFTAGVKEGDTILYSDALARLQEEVAKRVAIVQSQLKVDVTQGEFDALVSLVYNLKKQKIPPTMLAYLNGGFTDKGVAVGPEDYRGAMFQFPRNCRAGGVPSKGLYRRRLAESCVFAGLPWENACSANVVHLELTSDNEPDPNNTTSLEDTLLRAYSDVPIQKPPVDLNKPWPAPPATAQKPASDDLAPTTPLPKPAGAGAPKPAGEGAGASIQPSSPLPPPVSGKSPGTLGQANPLPPTPSPGPTILVPKPPAPVPIPPSVQVSTSNDMGPGIKNMFRTKRFWGGALIVLGRIIIALDVTGHFAAPVRALIGDGILMDWMTGVIVTTLGELIMDRGERKATMPMGTPREVALATNPVKS